MASTVRVDVESMYKCLGYVLDIITMNPEWNESFNPIDTSTMPHYDKFITRHIDLAVMQKKLVQRVYNTPEEFLADISWIVHNMSIYTTKDPSPSKNLKSKLMTAFTNSVKDIEHHITRLRERFNTFNYGPYMELVDPSRFEEQRRTMLPGAYQKKVKVTIKRSEGEMVAVDSSSNDEVQTLPSSNVRSEVEKSITSEQPATKVTIISPRKRMTRRMSRFIRQTEEGIDQSPTAADGSQQALNTLANNDKALECGQTTDRTTDDKIETYNESGGNPKNLSLLLRRGSQSWETLSKRRKSVIDKSMLSNMNAVSKTKSPETGSKAIETQNNINKNVPKAIIQQDAVDKPIGQKEATTLPSTEMAKDILPSFKELPQKNKSTSLEAASAVAAVSLGNTVTSVQQAPPAVLAADAAGGKTGGSNSSATVIVPSKQRARKSFPGGSFNSNRNVTSKQAVSIAAPVSDKAIVSIPKELVTPPSLASPIPIVESHQGNNNDALGSSASNDNDDVMIIEDESAPVTVPCRERRIVEKNQLPPPLVPKPPITFPPSSENNVDLNNSMQIFDDSSNRVLDHIRFVIEDLLKEMSGKGSSLAEVAMLKLKLEQQQQFWVQEKQKLQTGYKTPVIQSVHGRDSMIIKVSSRTAQNGGNTIGSANSSQQQQQQQQKNMTARYKSIQKAASPNKPLGVLLYE
uniref:Bromo domain-containing protein n=1 Tax=Anopheles culicifacies TaxID=139723 RepID=A0A182MI64_9DIPT